MAWHLPADTLDDLLGVLAPTAGDPAGRGGLQTLQGPYRAAASFKEMGILLFDRYRQLPRWYFTPVRVM